MEKQLRKRIFNYLERWILVNDKGHIIENYSGKSKEEAQFYAESHLGVEAIYYEPKKMKITLDEVDILQGFHDYVKQSDIFIKEHEESAIIDVLETEVHLVISSQADDN